ncbi:MAG: ATP-binding protein [Bacteroidales bacterium]|nr:ATP-binding protein [Bacteroidales bacterium]
MPKYIKRKKYLEKIKPYRNKDIIKVIVGQRRVGKSYFLYQIKNEIQETNKNVNIIYINKELYEFRNIIDYVDLMEYIQSKIIPAKETAIFIDEIQDIKNFEKALRSLQAEGKYDIYCSGSNANLLSGELATFLSGRYIEFKIFPLSYIEFLEFQNLKNSDNSFNKYLTFGGLPYLKNLELKDEIVFDYLSNIYKTILLKDVVARNKIRNVEFLQNLSEYIAENTGNIISAKKISDFLKSQRINISNNIVLNYLNFLTNAFLINKVKRSEIGGKKIFETGEKYYFTDIGLRNSIIGFRLQDIAKIYENLVYNHISRLGYDITIGKHKDREIDFICKKNNEKIYIQVTYILSDKKVIDREFGNLLKIKDNFPKLVISSDKHKVQTYQGVKHINIIDFLISEKISL